MLCSNPHYIALESANASIFCDTRQQKNNENPLFGNRCGHIAGSPRYYAPAPTQNKALKWLLMLVDRLKEAQQYAKKTAKRLFYHAKGRKKRSERCEAIILVSQVMVTYAEMWTLQVGTYRADGSFHAFDLPYIAAKAGVTMARAKRAINDLVMAGYVKVQEQAYKRADGAYRGLPAIRTLSTSFFTDFGIDYAALVRARDWKRKRIEKALAKIAKRQGRPFLGGLLKPFKRKYPAANPQATKQLSEAKQKALVEEALKIHAAYPDRAISDIYRELTHMLL